MNTAKIWPAMSHVSECVECGIQVVGDGAWEAGQVCLFGCLFCCSVSCAKAWATKNATPDSWPGTPGFRCAICVVDADGYYDMVDVVDEVTP